MADPVGVILLRARYPPLLQRPIRSRCPLSGPVSGGPSLCFQGEIIRREYRSGARQAGSKARKPILSVISRGEQSPPTTKRYLPLLFEPVLRSRWRWAHGGTLSGTRTQPAWWLSCNRSPRGVPARRSANALFRMPTPARLYRRSVPGARSLDWCPSSRNLV